MPHIRPLRGPRHGDRPARTPGALYLLLAVVIALPCRVPPAAAAGDAAPRPPATAPRIEYAAGLLTLRAVDAPLVDTLRAIGDAAGFDVRVFGEIERTLNREIDALPLERALAILLKDVSNARRYGDAPENRLIQLMLYGDSGGRDEPPPREPAPRQTAIVDRSLDPDRETALDELAARAGAGDSAGLLELARLLREDDDPAVRGAAASALGRSGDVGAVAILRDGLRDSGRTVRIRTIRALARIGGDHATQVLAEALYSHADTRTRTLAAWALGEQGTPLAHSYLDNARNDGDEVVRRAVIHARGGERPAAEP